MNVLSDTDQCLWDMLETPGIHVPPELNRQVRKLLERGISEYIRFRSNCQHQDKSPLVDFGLYVGNFDE